MGLNGNSTEPEQQEAETQQPRPSPVSWSVGALTADDGQRVMLLRFFTVTGSTVLFFGAEDARRLADALREQAGGIVLPPPPSFPGR